MRNLLKVSLTKNVNYKYSNIYNAQILDNQNITIIDIVGELRKDGLELDEKQVLDVIDKFNKKVSEKVFSGKNVCTGLVNISPFVKGPLAEKRWDSKVNKVEIVLTAGTDLTHSMSETTVEIFDEKQSVIGVYKLSDQLDNLSEYNVQRECKVDLRDTKLNLTEDPACGIAFRTWLWKS